MHESLLMTSYDFDDLLYWPDFWFALLLHISCPSDDYKRPIGPFMTVRNNNDYCPLFLSLLRYYVAGKKSPYLSKQSYCAYYGPFSVVSRWLSLRKFWCKHFHDALYDDAKKFLTLLIAPLAPMLLLLFPVVVSAAVVVVLPGSCSAWPSSFFCDCYQSMGD